MEITIHTERLHDDRIWARVVAFVAFLEKRGISATWFSINPTALPYQQMGFDEVKWKERLRYLVSHGQRIEQHTHFYALGKGAYDLSPAHVARRLDEDRAWLGKEGYVVTRFVSGGWRMNADTRDILRTKGYTDVTEDPRTLSPRASVTRILSGRAGTLPPLLYLHDYELANPLIAFLARYAAAYWHARPFSVVIHPHDHKRVRDWRKILRFIDNFFGDKELASVLELGAGTGNIAFRFTQKGVSATAEDNNSNYLHTIAARDRRITTLLHDINTPLPFKNSSFDAVFCIGALHYPLVGSWDTVMREALRVAKRYVVFDCFTRHSVYAFLEGIFYPLFKPRRYDDDEITAACARLHALPIAKIGIRFGKSAIYVLEKKTS